MRAPDLLGVAPDRLLHAQGGVAGPDGVVLVGERRAEQRHDAVAHHLVDGALVAVDGLHHPLEHRVEQLPGLLGVAVGDQLRRALEVGEQDGDLLALAFQSASRGEDLLGEVLRGVGLRATRTSARRRLPATQGSAALAAELRAGRQLGAARAQAARAGRRTPGRTWPAAGSRAGTADTAPLASGAPRLVPAGRSVKRRPFPSDSEGSVDGPPFPPPCGPGRAR